MVGDVSHNGEVLEETVYIVIYWKNEVTMCTFLMFYDLIKLELGNKLFVQLETVISYFQ